MLGYSSQECRSTKSKQLLHGSQVHGGHGDRVCVYDLLTTGSGWCIKQHQRNPGVNGVPDKTGVRGSGFAGDLRTAGDTDCLIDSQVP